MFKRPKRVTRADFAKIHSKNRLQGRFFTLLYEPAQDGPKFACMVSKKVSTKANIRNTIKRRGRAALREVPDPGKYLIVLSAKNSAGKATYGEILADVTHLLSGLKN